MWKVKQNGSTHAAAAGPELRSHVHARAGNFFLLLLSYIHFHETSSAVMSLLNALLKEQKRELSCKKCAFPATLHFLALVFLWVFFSSLMTLIHLTQGEDTV